MPAKRVLVTGMSGLIGRAVRKQLEGKYDLVALNRRPVEGVKCYQADITQLDAILPAFEGVDTVVHLAAEAHDDSPWKTYLDKNVIGTYNVFEASRMKGVKRIVYASSGATMKGVENDPPYDAIVQGRYDEVPKDWKKVTHLSRPRPGGIYACTKMWGEALASMYSDMHGISALCLRIGGVNEEDRPTGTRSYSVWCSKRDVATLVERCVNAPSSLTFDIFYASSNNKWSYRDMEHAREVLGFIPQDSADSFR
jgi:uronate dehydrogenase